MNGSQIKVKSIDKHDLKGLEGGNQKPRENATSYPWELDSIVLRKILKIVKQIKHEILRTKLE